MVKVAFLQNIYSEYIGVSYLSAVLKQHDHQCDVFIEGEEKDLIGTLKRYNPDIIAFLATIGVHNWVLKISKELKKHFNVKILVGGPHTTFFPEFIQNPNIDIICIGEGEYAMLELADKIKKKEDITKIKNLWVKEGNNIFKNELRPLIQNLDELPFADREIYYKYKILRDHATKMFVTGRGCPYNCTYCFNPSYLKLYKRQKIVRYRNAEKIIQEIKDFKEKYPLKVVSFNQDTFTLNKPWVLDFLKRYEEEVGLPFICSVRVDSMDEEIIIHMKKANCVTVMFGIESGSEKLRNGLLKKAITNKQILETARLLRKYGIKFRTQNMIGLPTETVEDAFDTIKINALIKTDFPWCSIFQPYPRTEIESYTRELGLIDPFPSKDFCAFYFNSSILKQKNIKQLINLHRFFYLGAKFPFLNPLIKQLIKLRPNFVFDTLFRLTFAYRYMKENQLGIIDTLRLGLRSKKEFG